MVLVLGSKSFNTWPTGRYAGHGVSGNETSSPSVSPCASSVSQEEQLREGFQMLTKADVSLVLFYESWRESEPHLAVYLNHAWCRRV